MEAEYTCNKENMELLCKELETTDKIQGTGKLKDSIGKYCCLGIACEVYHKATGKGTWEIKHGFQTFVVDGSESCTQLPIPVINWLGHIIIENTVLKIGLGDISLNMPPHSAIGMNDSGQYGFKEIAAALRETYLSGENNGIQVQ